MIANRLLINKQTIMNLITKYLGHATLALSLTGLLASCDTDVESLDIAEPGIEEQNPELYAQYLANLKAYKQSSHRVAIGWFDNSEKQPVSQGQHIHAVPDSLDYVVLTSPANLTSTELAEIEQLRSEKGTRVVYEISFEDLQLEYDALSEDNAGTLPSLNEFLVDSVQARLALCDRYGLDGVVMAYNGKEKMYQDDDTRTELIGLENDFLGMARDWAERHTDKQLLLMGKPQNVEDQTVFSLARYIILPCQSETSASGLTYVATKAAADGVPSDKLVPLVTTTSLDATDTKTGYWGDKASAVLGAARWAAADHQGFTAAGLAIDNMARDYYNPTFTYPNVRTAITIINPTAKQ